MIAILPLTTIPEVRPSDDLAALLESAVQGLVLPGDVLIVTQKIVSKAEGRFVELVTVVPGAAALDLAAVVGKDPRLVELVLSESTAVVRAAPGVLITRHRSGHVMANAGIDRSNLGTSAGSAHECVLLLPEDPDRSATTIARHLCTRLGWPLPVVIADSFGRPWRMGVVNVAIGASGLAVLLDHRGQLDRDRRILEVTQVATADMLASAAGLAMGEGPEGVPAALVRGASWVPSETGIGPMVRPEREDLFA